MSRTEMTLEIVGDEEAALEILRDLADGGVVLHQARIQGTPIDVTPLRAAALLASADGAEEFVEGAETDEEALAAIDMTERAGEVALEHIRAGRLAVSDFEGRTASGATGFTIADVEEIVAENAPAEPAEA